MMNIRLKSLLKFSALYSLLIVVRLGAEMAYIKVCASSVMTFIVGNGSPICSALRTAADMPMEKFITYIN
jgi:hypothetical protein